MKVHCPPSAVEQPAALEENGTEGSVQKPVRERAEAHRPIACPSSRYAPAESSQYGAADGDHTPEPDVEPPALQMRAPVLMPLYPLLRKVTAAHRTAHSTAHLLHVKAQLLPKE